MGFIEQGTIHRFNSVTELIALCRTQFPSAKASAANNSGDFILRVRGGGLRFDSLIVHSEGSRCYLVMLPEVVITADAS
ncbi:MAG: hypothetical protein GY814_06870 [Gammaproteobacteria bacterium]|nr:hypothetical protein [Gammaproteobacteria bacterium]